MPLEAPRFTPGGVRVGNMPTPQVRPDTGTADALNAIGGAIAQTGKAAEAITSAMEKRDADALRAKKDQAETAGQDAYTKWQIDTKRRYADFTQQAVGSKVARQQDAFDAYLRANTDQYTEGLSPEAVAAFNRRKEIAAYALSADSRVYSSAQVQKFTVETANQEMTDSAAEAANALLTRNTEAYNVSLGRAISAAQRRDAITGAETKPEEIQSVVLHSAATDLRKREDHLGLVEFYRENKGKFGVREAEVRTLAQDSMDAVDAEHLVGTAIPDARDANGNLDGKLLQERLVAESESYKSDGAPPSANAQHKAMLLADRALKSDLEDRNAIGQQYLISLEEALQTGRLTEFQADARTQEYAKRLTGKDAATAQDRVRWGPSKSNPDIVTMLDYARNSPVGSPTYQEFLALDINKAALNRDDKQKYFQLQQKARQSDSDSIDQKISKVTKDVWERGGLRALPNVAPGKEADTEQAKQIADFNLMRDGVSKKMAEEVAAGRANAESTEDIKRVTAMWITQEAQKPESTWSGWRRVGSPLYQMPESTFGRYSAPVSSAERAKLDLPANAPAGQVQLAATRQRILDDEKKKVQEQEKEAEKKAADEAKAKANTPGLGAFSPAGRFYFSPLN